MKCDSKDILILKNVLVLRKNKFDLVLNKSDTVLHALNERIEKSIIRLEM